MDLIIEVDCLWVGGLLSRLGRTESDRYLIVFGDGPTATVIHNATNDKVD